MAGAVQRVATFLQGVREEMRLVSWPTREDVFGSSLVVLVGVVLLAAYISVCDVVLSHTTKLFLK
ncbi:MAG: preprotein translocase subunit SecE [Candidatus Omnitrophica bacterium]|nr:preprotein translocase subunit SecE [Candidatus Omnitrophota bacterium]